MRIFEEFEQVETGTTRSHGGVGLGSVDHPKRLVAAMGGDICIDSEPGKGSEFTIDSATIWRRRQLLGKQKLVGYPSAIVAVVERY